MLRLILIFLIVLGCSRNEDNLNEKISNKDFSEENFSYYEGLSNFNLVHDGYRREYFIYIPPNIESRENLPVIFNFHGYSGQAQQFFNMTDLRGIANENGVVLVYPQGAPLDGGASHWNAAPLNSLTPSFVNKSNMKDLEFFLALLDEVNQNNILDLNRVYAIGYSNGGMFSHFLACNTNNIFAAIGDVAGTMLEATYNNCNPSSPIPVLKIHGTSDPVVAYDGFEQEGFKTVDEVIDFWRSNNNLNGEVIFDDLGNSQSFNSQVGFEKYTYESNENNSSIVHYKMVRGGHWWDYSLDDNLKTSRLLWDFFKNHTKSD